MVTPKGGDQTVNVIFFAVRAVLQPSLASTAISPFKRFWMVPTDREKLLAASRTLMVPAPTVATAAAGFEGLLVYD